LFAQDASQGPVNLGNQNEFTMIQLANLILLLTNSTSKIVYRDLPMDDPKQRKPDIKMAELVINWAPTIEIEQGLLATIEDIEGRL
jgi:UDP-glucuronate decarboxylase